MVEKTNAPWDTVMLALAVETVTAPVRPYTATAGLRLNTRKLPAAMPGITPLEAYAATSDGVR